MLCIYSHGSVYVRAPIGLVSVAQRKALADIRHLLLCLLPAQSGHLGHRLAVAQRAVSTVQVHDKPSCNGFVVAYGCMLAGEGLVVQSHICCLAPGKR